MMDNKKLIELINRELPNGYRIEYVDDTTIELLLPDDEAWCGWDHNEFNIDTIKREISIEPVGDPLGFVSKTQLLIIKTSFDKFFQSYKV